MAGGRFASFMEAILLGRGSGRTDVVMKPSTRPERSPVTPSSYHDMQPTSVLVEHGARQMPEIIVAS